MFRAAMSNVLLKTLRYRLSSPWTRQQPCYKRAGNLQRSLSSSNKFSVVLNEYLRNANIDESLHHDVLKALESVYGDKLTTSHLDKFGPNGLKDLAASIANEKKRNSARGKRPRRSVVFRIPHHQTEFQLAWKLGDSLVDLSRSSQGMELLHEYIEAACGGNASCSTCHIYLDEASRKLLPPPSESEEDMLDLAYEPTEASRLGCQVRLDEKLLQADHDIVVTIPEGVNNMWN